MTSRLSQNNSAIPAVFLCRLAKMKSTQICPSDVDLRPISEGPSGSERPRALEGSPLKEGPKCEGPTLHGVMPQRRKLLSPTLQPLHRRTTLHQLALWAFEPALAPATSTAPLRPLAVPGLLTPSVSSWDYAWRRYCRCLRLQPSPSLLPQ